MYIVECVTCGKTAGHEDENVAEGLAELHLLGFRNCSEVNVYAPGEWNK